MVLSRQKSPRFLYQIDLTIFQTRNWIPVVQNSCLGEHEASIGEDASMCLSGIAALSDAQGGILIADLKLDLHLCIAAARGFLADHSDVDVFIDSARLR